MAVLSRVYAFAGVCFGCAFAGVCFWYHGLLGPSIQIQVGRDQYLKKHTPQKHTPVFPYPVVSPRVSCAVALELTVGGAKGSRTDEEARET